MNPSFSLSLTAALASVVFLPVSATAAVTAFRGAPNPTTLRNETLAQAGWGFSASSTGTAQINQLGFWVAPNQAGGAGMLQVSHTVGLYNFNGSGYTLLASATVPAGATADENGYAWTEITPITLTDTRQGADFYVVMASMAVDTWGPFTGNANAPVLNGSFGTPTGNGPFTGTAFPVVGGASSFVFTPNNGGYIGPNVGFATPVPEPGSFLTAAGLALGALTRRRRM